MLLVRTKFITGFYCYLRYVVLFCFRFTGHTEQHTGLTPGSVPGITPNELGGPHGGQEWKLGQPMSKASALPTALLQWALPATEGYL